MRRPISVAKWVEVMAGFASALGLKSPFAMVVLALVLGGGGCKDDEDLPDFPDPDVVGTDTNPDGDPYPTDNIGGRPRGGGRRGDRIANFKFQGYRDGDRSKGLAPISLAEYFDPKQKR